MSEELPEKRMEILENVWRDLVGVKTVDIRFYNTLLQVYLENENEFSPYDFISELKAKGVEADRLV